MKFPNKPTAGKSEQESQDWHVTKAGGEKNVPKKGGFQLPQLPKIQFQDSGWILLYRFSGWMCLICGGIGLGFGLADDAKGAITKGVIFLCGALLASLPFFFAAHVLRLQEKIAHHAERTADAIERLEKKAEE